MKQALFTVGFYSPAFPGVLQIWRPKEHSEEATPRQQADERFDHLVAEMLAGRRVDDLFVASVWMNHESTNEFVRSMTSDGVEAKPKPGDSDFARVYRKPIRGQC